MTLKREAVSRELGAACTRPGVSVFLSGLCTWQRQTQSKYNQSIPSDVDNTKTTKQRGKTGKFNTFYSRHQANTPSQALRLRVSATFRPRHYLLPARRPD
jgi:hypothetical protein